MSFKFYKFCQNGLVTFITSLFACFIIGMFLFDLPLFGSIVLSVVGTAICFVPIISILYPFLLFVYLVLACIGAFSHFSFYASLILLILHVIRMVSMLSFVRKHPDLSLEYDKAIRGGYKL